MSNEAGYTAQSITLAVAPKVPALLSLCGSLYIVWSVLSSKQKRSNIYHRLMLGLSCSDILASHVYFLGTWLIPRGSSGPFGDVYWAAGTERTCNYSGFFNQVGVASPLYNASLSIYYLLHIHYGWREGSLKRIETAFHLFPVTFALGTSITALSTDLYGNVFWTCWINPDPPQANTRHFQWAFLFAPVWISVSIQTVVMTSLWWKMRRQEKLIARKYDLRHPTDETNESETGSNLGTQGNPEVDEETGTTNAAHTSQQSHHNINDNGSKHSSRIAVQGSLYVLAFYVAWFFPTVQRITELAHGTNFFVIQALDTTLLPLQGFFNVIIYLRPKYLNYRSKYPDISMWAILKIIHEPSEERAFVSNYRSTATAKHRTPQRIQNHSNGTSGGSDPAGNNDNSRQSLCTWERARFSTNYMMSSRLESIPEQSQNSDCASELDASSSASDQKNTPTERTGATNVSTDWSLSEYQVTDDGLLEPDKNTLGEEDDNRICTRVDMSGQMAPILINKI